MCLKPVTMIKVFYAGNFAESAYGISSFPAKYFPCDDFMELSDMEIFCIEL